MSPPCWLNFRAAAVNYKHCPSQMTGNIFTIFQITGSCETNYYGNVQTNKCVERIYLDISLAVVTSLLLQRLTQLRSGCSQIWQFVLRGDACYEFPGLHCGGVSKCLAAESISAACSGKTKECAKQTAQCHEGSFLVSAAGCAVRCRTAVHAPICFATRQLVFLLALICPWESPTPCVRHVLSTHPFSFPCPAFLLIIEICQNGLVFIRDTSTFRNILPLL